MGSGDADVAHSATRDRGSPARWPSSSYDRELSRLIVRNIHRVNFMPRVVPKHFNCTAIQYAPYSPLFAYSKRKKTVQIADRGVQMHQVGAELAETGVKRPGLAGQLGALADQGGGGEVG